MRNTPKPNTTRQAKAIAFNALETVKVPVGSNPAVSIWATVSDLTNNIYYFKPYMLISTSMKDNRSKIYFAPFNTRWKAYSLNQLFKQKRMPNSFIPVRVKPGPVASADQAAFVDKLNYAPVAGGSRASVEFVNVR